MASNKLTQADIGKKVQWSHPGLRDEVVYGLLLWVAEKKIEGWNVKVLWFDKSRGEPHYPVELKPCHDWEIELMEEGESK